MPQLWLTFEEIADLFYCDTAAARGRVIASQWERRRYSDGLTRPTSPGREWLCSAIGWARAQRASRYSCRNVGFAPCLQPYGDE